MSSMAGDLSMKCLECSPGLALRITPRTVDIGGFAVHRALPSKQRQMVGPFIFWDQIGPGEFAKGKGVDVRPHPHIGLSTVTYLFDGSLDHKDSLGNDLRILPGELNLMTAGKGIVHSERTGQDIRASSSALAGIQSWLALPKSHEECEPEFTHFGQGELPSFDSGGCTCRLILGEFAGYRSPVTLPWETLYLEVKLSAGAELEFPQVVEERAIHLVAGRLEIGGQGFDERQMIVVEGGAEPRLKAASDCHLLFLGGAPIDGPRYIWWNFVASSVEKLAEAASRWEAKDFPPVPGDNQEFIPLPDSPLPQKK
jgi:redox-sensitive bicupin YhaK (pirin superfamily)